MSDLYTVGQGQTSKCWVHVVEGEEDQDPSDKRNHSTQHVHTHSKPPIGTVEQKHRDAVAVEQLAVSKERRV